MIYEIVTLPPSLWAGMHIDTTRVVATSNVKGGFLLTEGRDFNVPSWSKYLTMEEDNINFIERGWIASANPNSLVLMPVFVKITNKQTLNTKGFLFTNGINAIIAQLQLFQFGKHTETVISPTALILAHMKDRCIDGMISQGAAIRLEQCQHVFRAMANVAPGDNVLLDTAYELYMAPHSFVEHEYMEYFDGYIDSLSDYSVPTACNLQSLDPLSRELAARIPVPMATMWDIQLHCTLTVQQQTLPPDSTPLELISTITNEIACAGQEFPRFRDIWCDIQQLAFNILMSTNLTQCRILNNKGAPIIDLSSIRTKYMCAQPPHIPFTKGLDITVSTVELTMYSTYEILVTINFVNGDIVNKYIDGLWYAIACYSVANENLV